MKKYLMTGIAALTMCFGFTSCSHDFDTLTQEEIDQRKADEIVENYKKAFIAQFGQPAADQDWGFGTSETRSMTRSISDMEAGANKNRNLWAATDGNFNLLVPTPLTEGQKNRVRAYFQTHRYLTWETPDMTSYFVQQVYTGGTNTSGSETTESYTKGNNTPVVGGQHMDKLSVTQNNVHVLDFNAANNVNTATDVKNNGTLTNDTQYHSDQITLMINTQPTCVGYHTSDGSVQHNDCCALVSAKTIDDWARSLDTPIGEDVWYGKDQYGYDNSFWERSFVGLDYEQVPASQAFATVAWNDPTPVYVKVDEIQPGIIWDSVTDTYLTKAEYKALHNTEYLLDADGNKIPWISSNTNEYLGTSSNFASQTDYMPQKDGKGQVLDIRKIYAKVADNCYPVSSKQLQEWIKNVGGRDYYFSDWIVTLAPAKQNTPTPPTPPTPPDEYTIRVIAEDLTFGKDLNTDFDFNDVVFDVCLKANETKIRLKAAGGTLPLIIGVANPQNDQDYLENEVHNLFRVAVNVMVNTNAHLKGLNSDSKNDVIFTLNTAYTDAKDIPVYVKKNGTWVELKAVQGEPASKIGVGLDYVWVNERESLKGTYDKFVKWVRADANERNFKWW